ncbi:transcriptional regulator [Alkalihalobacillus alcalophilus ATCC 27647 = CGMCC 1.3604]|uniref:Transcriptional regulator n=1 Tax=Alkalihalobacillus alcalophilus ATCC 27647 = CGMCC 1.3604 TaxID=1218173 RepID=A0A094YR62_ALKAL|nr:AraC family transcriptional regulator [Alkalihalobacillus alcalophilus]KGA95962.1 transcriptional regulator [Alkalihalobacillus alcalophilus ATCC 27647 = CGMCC 1.3604]MED1563431.1 AraC family transcriptional regulator [Alkalihalobacillus alcalophilus]THG90948.1 transcriptional regulator [Alkalihalobacillus alcalophilus ATCC 27647 = CGMCC 1.3604]
MMEAKRRYSFSTSESFLPLFIESIGYNPNECEMNRPNGYPYYHWIQTVEGEGKISFNNEEMNLTKGKGVLLFPHTPHKYYPKSNNWSTICMTFGGSAADSILNALQINRTAAYMETDEGSFQEIIFQMIEAVEEEETFLQLDYSKDLYHFLIMIKKFGQMNNHPSLSQSYEKIKPVVSWLEQKLGEDIRLPDMARYAKMSSQYLNLLFRESFGMSPYSYLIQLRIRESKRLLISEEGYSLKEITKKVGFKDVSHFVATFRRKEGITPKKYRNLHKVSAGV